MEVQVVLERDQETGHWVAEAPGVPGAYTEGPSKEEALRNLRDVFEHLHQAGGIPTQPHVEFARLRVEA